MNFNWLLFFVSGIVHVSSEIANKRMSYGPQSGPLCWGPGTWPHPQHCRLFTICQLKVEVKGQLFVCPEQTGFSPKHLRCIPDVLIPGCQQSAPLEQDSLDLSTAVKLAPPEDRDQPAASSPCIQEAAPFCQDTAILVLCGPNNKFMGTVNCTSQRQHTSGHCDKTTKSCVLIHHLPSEAHKFLPSSTKPPTTVTDPATEEATTVTDPATEEATTVTDLTEEDETMVAEASLHDLPAPFVAPNDTATTSPPLPPSEDIVCLRPGLQCHDNVTIVDCPEDLSEPDFVMSCANIIVTEDSNATGYCDAENPSCVLLVDNVVMSLEVSTFDFGDVNKTEDDEAEFDELDDDYVGPEMYDSDMLRESSGLFDGLSWFRNGPDGKRFEEGRAQRARSAEEKVKKASVIRAPPGSDETLAELMTKCNEGGLYCFDNTTLLACSGDRESATYAVRCYGRTEHEGRTLEAYCDGAVNSCVVNLVDGAR